ncbi:glycosyltransferase (plasmid) [Halocatena salina]|uniref:Glycosyltransferase n=1 Tax=Halocatena salina TaxID=2934340 RepID=A0A8U0A658_9EURY|nr:glycosyltransferase [Halocatena salina]UPM44661.1 glycosyltransferase [Halocatena salina]
MTVSVIMSTYNRSAVVRTAIESILRQTYEDLKCIVIDGGSTDGTQRVVDSFDDPMSPSFPSGRIGGRRCRSKLGYHGSRW